MEIIQTSIKEEATTSIYVMIEYYMEPIYYYL